MANNRSRSRKGSAPKQNPWRRRFMFKLACDLGVVPFKGATIKDIQQCIESGILELSYAMEDLPNACKVNGIPMTIDPEVPTKDVELVLYSLLTSKLYPQMDYEIAVAVLSEWQKGGMLAGTGTGGFFNNLFPNVRAPEGSGGGLRQIASDIEDESLLDNLGDFFDSSDGGFGSDLADLVNDIFT